jgi:acetoin utilization deacetylase AcuC-like enzyme
VLTIYSAMHARHHGRGEFTDGRFVPCFDTPRRAEMVLAAVGEAGHGPVEAPVEHGRAPIERVHDPRLVAFLETAHAAWRELGREDDALPMTWPTRALRDREPRHILGRLGYWCFDAGTPIGPGTWDAAYWAAQVALSGAARLQGGERAVFALCRPPGHHAAAGAYGGYCFLNNAAIAAHAIIDKGATRLAILDVDYHHGNGTQAIFYDRPDVLVVSIHADPADEYPFFLGHADETGIGAGIGCNLNLPLPLGADTPAYFAALERACGRVDGFGPEFLLVSLGVDTYAGDPISTFWLQRGDFYKLGARIARLGRPVLFVLEGGYAVEEIGANVAAVLSGFEESAA